MRVGPSIPGERYISREGPALETAQGWRAQDTAWTDGSRLDGDRAAAACAWRILKGWTGRRLRLGNSKKVFDADTFAIYQALRVLDLQQETDRKYAIFSDSQSAIRRISSDDLGPGQQ